MNELQILKDIIKKLTKLEKENNNKIEDVLDRSRRKLIMIVERKFGQGRDYLNQLKTLQEMEIGPGIYYFYQSQSSIDREVREDLIIKRDRYLNFIETILDELKIEEAKGKLDELVREEIGDNVEERLIRILKRFHRFAKQLKRHQGKSTIQKIEIQNEYDVQDLLHAILKLEFDDVRPEEYTPSYAGSNSRIDFLLKREQIAIEVKKTSEQLKDKEIGAQLNDDIAKYQNHQNCKTLYCFIYDPKEFISNPDGIQNDLSKEIEGLSVKVIISPKR